MAAMLLALYAIPAWAQELEPDTNEIESVDEVLISSQRLGDTRSRTSRQIEVITARDIELAQQPNMGEVLAQSGQVFVQKSQLGGGSPVLRGFEASRVLLVIDGVRMNNATYRAGHLQDIVTVDPFMLERTEIYFGSGSTLYGSDALGGVIYLQSKQAKFTDKFSFNPTALLRYSSAGNNITGNVGWNLGTQKMAWIFNYTYNQFGDLSTGKGRNYSGIDTFGMRGYFVETIDGKDYVRKNNKPWTQVKTGYTQSDVNTKLSVKHGRWVSTLNLQGSLNDGMPRYDRLTQVRSGTLRFSEWSYTPQNRYFGSITSECTQNDKIKHRFILSSQHTEVGRRTRGINKPVALTQLDKVNMHAFNYDNQIQVSKRLKVVSGLEWVYNSVNSTAFYDSIINNKQLPSKESRYADSFAHTNSISVFAQVVYDLKPGDFSLNGGIRFSQYSALASFTQNNFWGLTFSNVKVTNFAPVFNLGAVKKVYKDFSATLNLSSGFRNPNIDDLTKLFESLPGEKYITPNPKLKPEQTQTVDVGLRYNKRNSISLEGGVYQTWIKNLLIDMPAQLNGSDSIVYNGELTPVFRMDNAASGFVRGAYLSGKVKLHHKLFFDFHYTVTYGRYRASSDAKTVPLDHIAPDYGKLGFRFADKSIQAELFMLFNGWKTLSSYSLSGEDNAAQSPAGRNPAWQTYNLRGSYQVNQKMACTLGIENLLDLHYRVFASGISAPGRNIIASVRISM